MRNQIRLLGMLIIMGFSATAQDRNGGQIKGKVQDPSDKNLEAASVSLVKARDSSLVKGDFTSAEGVFQFSGISQGEYRIVISSVGFKRQFSPLISLAEGQKLDLGTVKLEAAGKELKEVVVSSKRPPFEQKVDRTVVNVEASVTNTGATALEVLEKSPGVTVDKDGNISLKGKAGVMVMIDGKPFYLGGQDLANLLRNLNAAQLDQIEIMTNPPAKYDAAGNAGVINIKTKKNKIRGFNGSINSSYGQGVYPKLSESLNLNYRNGKFNLFGNYNYGYRKNFQSLDINRKFMTEDTKELVSIFDQHARPRSRSYNHNLKLGVDYYLSKKTTLGAVVNGFMNDNNFRSDIETDIRSASGELLTFATATSNTRERWKNFSSNLNLRHVFDSTGKELAIDMDYMQYRSTNDQLLTNSYFNADGSTQFPTDTLLGDLPSRIHIYSAKADYTHPLKKDGKIEAGFKLSFVNTDNDARYDSLKNGVIVPDLGRTNYFIYEEQIQAVYVNFQKQLSKKWGMQVGLRAENTISKGDQRTTGETFERNYLEFFPTAYFSYKASDKHSFVLNYGRRIERPDYQDLNPFINFLDRYTFQQGNPNLKPQFSHNLEFSHSFKGAINTTLNYTRTDDIIMQVIEQNELTNETYVKQSNIAKQRQVGLSISGFMPVKKWWSVNFYTNAYYNQFEGVVNQTNISEGAFTVMFNGTSQFKFEKGWSAEVSGFYRTRGVEGVMVIQPMGSINFGVGKNILKNKGTLRLNLRDPFYLQNFRGYSRFSNVDVQIRNRWDNRVATLSFSYRFGKPMNGQAPRKRAGGASEEQNRVKVNAGS